jgi:uncharacterized repeat protein (TIGR02543 family)
MKSGITGLVPAHWPHLIKGIISGICLLFFLSSLGYGADFTGNYTGSWSSPPDTGQLSASISQSGSTLTGTLTIMSTECGNFVNLPLSGSASGNVVNFAASSYCGASPARLNYTNGVLSGDTISGSYNVYVDGAFYDSGSYTLTRAATTRSLSVTKSGMGSGTVTSSPSSINCGTTCSASFSSGTGVTLTATANSGSTFVSWSGCDGVNGNACTVNMNAARSVTALFGVVRFPDMYFDIVQKLYIGYYQRPADPEGFLFWARGMVLYDADGDFGGADIVPALEQFAYSAEARALYGGDITGSNIATVVDSIYMGLFGRHAEPGGLAWWINSFSTGASTPATILWELMKGAQGTDAQTIQNRLVTANVFTEIIDPNLDGLPPFQAAYPDGARTRQWLAGVTWDPVTIPTEDQIRAYLAGTGNTYTLTVNATNGSVTRSPNQANYSAGSTVTLTAIPNQGYTFANWTGNLTGTTSPAIITMNSNKTVAANFVVTPTETYTLTVNATNGSVTKSPDQSSYSAGTLVFLSAIPNQGYTFVNWTGDLAGSTSPVPITMNSNKTVWANFSASTPGTYTLTVNAANGSVAVSPRQVTFSAGSTVTLEAVPYRGYTFVNWTGDLTGTTNPVTITMNSNKTVWANFSAPTTQTITLYSAKDATLIWSDVSTSFQYNNYGTGNMEVGNAYYWGYFVSTLGKYACVLDFLIDPILGKSINSAKLRMYIDSTYPQYYYGHYRLYPITADWNEYAVTWNTGVYIYPNVYTDPDIATSSAYTEWDVTSIVSGWANGTIPTWGFYIKDITPANSHGLDVVEQMTTYISRDSGNPQAYHPQLIIEYQ